MWNASSTSFSCQANSWSLEQKVRLAFGQNAEDIKWAMQLFLENFSNSLRKPFHGFWQAFNDDECFQSTYCIQWRGYTRSQHCHVGKRQTDVNTNQLYLKRRKSCTIQLQLFTMHVHCAQEHHSSCVSYSVFVFLLEGILRFGLADYKLDFFSTLQLSWLNVFVQWIHFPSQYITTKPHNTH